MKDSWKPRKKTIYIISALVALSLLFVWFTREKIIVPLLSPSDIVPASAEEVSSRDTDGDGIRDWEEYLWGLNPNSKDTNNDGVSDFDEIATKKVALREISEVGTTTASSTFTDSFSREFFVAFTSLKQSGNLTTANINKISQQSIEALTQTTFTEKYSKKDLLVASSTQAARTAYAKAISGTGKGLAITKLGRELELLNRAINKPRSEKLIKELESIQKIYLALAERTIAIPAPSAIQNTHLDLANIYYKLGAAVGGLTQIYDDPALSVVYFSEYQKALEKLPVAMSAISTYVK